ncbi:hypothetical protein SAMN04487971_11935 [Paracoccus chinensis]|uniref:Uncharacterized protein n=1 Tax=Paracoccus chinensis TaxID=525640 RepID=A0A1G9MAG8_9RHOB|nr:hypothetical protein SAMN04487971_11935 [Paracoccus chinensis]
MCSAVFSSMYARSRLPKPMPLGTSDPQREPSAFRLGIAPAWHSRLNLAFLP